jgi:hypothetical protein
LSITDSKLAILIATEEGFYVAGSIPQRFNNPGDLRHSPHSFHTVADPDGIGQIDTPQDGWADLERQLHLFAGRGLTMEQMIYGVPDAQGVLQGGYAPESENDSAAYLAYLCTGLGCQPSTLVSDALKIV